MFYQKYTVSQKVDEAKNFDYERDYFHSIFHIILNFLFHHNMLTAYRSIYRITYQKTDTVYLCKMRTDVFNNHAVT